MPTEGNPIEAVGSPRISSSHFHEHDFWTLRPDPFEAEMFARRLRVILFGEPAWIATAEDTISNT